jgi:hypothetical protein
MPIKTTAARRWFARAPRLAATLVLALLALGAVSASAWATFPFYGAGSAGQPSSWKLLPGETVSNLGTELTQHFGAVPQTPSAS